MEATKLIIPTAFVMRDSTGVRRRMERDGLGREAWWWIANININGHQVSRRWSVDKHGGRQSRSGRSGRNPSDAGLG